MREKIKIMLEQFSFLQDLYFQYLNLVENKIKILLQENDVFYQALHSRVKSYDSLVVKLNNSGIYEEIKDDVKNISDIVGIRIVFYERDSMDEFKKVINNCFKVIDWKNNIKIDDTDKKNIKYRAEHYILGLNDDKLIKYKGFKFELQLVTILSHAGNELGHNFFYKNENELKEKNPTIFDEMQEQYYSAWRDLLSAESKFNIIRKQAKEITVGNQIIIKIISKQYIERINKVNSYLGFGYIIEDLKSAVPFLSDNSISLIKENKLLESLLQKLYELRNQYSTENSENDILDNFNYAFSETLEFLKIYIYLYVDRLPEIILKLNEIINLENGLYDTYSKFLKNLLVQDKYKKIYVINDSVYEWLISLDDNQKVKYIKEILTLSDEFLNLEVSGADWSAVKTVTFHSYVLNPSKKFIEKRRNVLELLLELLIKVNPDKEIIDVILGTIHNPYNNTNKQIKEVLNADTNQIFDFIMKHYEEIDIFYKFQIISNWYIFLKRSKNKIVKNFKDKSSKDIYLNLYNNIFAWYIREKLDFDEDRRRRRNMLNSYAKKIDKKDLDFIVKIYESYSNYKYNSIESSYYMDLMYQIGKMNPDLSKKINDKIYKKYSNYCPYLMLGILANENQDSYLEKIKRKLKANKEIQKAFLECIHFCNYDDNYDVFRYITNLDNIDLEIKSEIAKIILNKNLRDQNYLNLLFNIIKEANENNYYINFSITPNMEDSIRQILTENRIEDLLCNLNLSNYINTINSYILKIIFEIEPNSVRQFYEKRLLSKNRLKYRDEYYYIKKAKNLDEEFNNNLNWIMRLVGENKYNIYPISEIAKLLLGKFNIEIEQALLKKIERKNISIRQCMTIIWFLKMFSDWASVSNVAKEIVKKYGNDDKIKNEIGCLLFDTGVVSGEYGLADAFKQKSKMMKKWQKDDSEIVKEFAKENSKLFDSYSKKEIEDVIFRNCEEEESFKVKNR